MSAAQELNALALRKELIRARIAARRQATLAAAAKFTPALRLADQGVALWRRIPGKAKWIGVPAGFLLARWVGRRFGIATSLLRYAPVAYDAFQAFRVRRHGPAPRS